MCVRREGGEGGEGGGRERPEFMEGDQFEFDVFTLLEDAGALTLEL